MLAMRLGLPCLQGLVAYSDLSWFVASQIIANQALVLTACLLLRRYSVDGNR